MLYFIVTALLWLTPAAPAQEPLDSPSFEFPSTTESSLSNSGAIRATYRSSPRGSDGITEYDLLLLDRRGNEIRKLPFERSVEGTWAPSSDRLFINNYIGSNLIDCLVVSESSDSFILTSLTDILLKEPNRAMLVPETPETAHFYLTCSRWVDNNTIQLQVRGYSETMLREGTEFVRGLTYHIRDRRFTLRG